MCFKVVSAIKKLFAKYNIGNAIIRIKVNAKYTIDTTREIVIKALFDFVAWKLSIENITIYCTKDVKIKNKKLYSANSLIYLIN